MGGNITNHPQGTKSHKAQGLIYLFSYIIHTNQVTLHRLHYILTLLTLHYILLTHSYTHRGSNPSPQHKAKSLEPSAHVFPTLSLRKQCSIPSKPRHTSLVGNGSSWLGNFHQQIRFSTGAVQGLHQG